MTKGYKVFNPDWTSKHGDIVFKVGETYELTTKPALCKEGFHFCTNIADCFKYYSSDLNNKIAEVEALGDITNPEKDCSKIATNKIKILRELTFQDAYVLGNQGKNNIGFNNTGNNNIGDYNTGYCNTGYCNTGNKNTGSNNTGYNNAGNNNTGNWNTGDYNTGYCNTGNWNTCDFETGFFNTKQEDYIRVFNKKCKRSDWEKCDKPNFIHFNLTEWINAKHMTQQEKENYAEYQNLDGYLKEYQYKEAFINSFKKADSHNVKLLLKLPNFNYQVFEEISGITKKMIQEKLKENKK